MANIYKRQLDKLDVSVDQYAKLVEMPTDIVKNIVNGSELSVSMEWEKFFRKNIFDKHQKIENEFENTKLKVLNEKIESEEEKVDNKLNEDIYMNWYIYEYDKNDFFKKHNFKSVPDCERNMFISLPKWKNHPEGGKVSNSIYDRLLNKQINQIGKKILPILVKQLYEFDKEGKHRIEGVEIKVNSNQIETKTKKVFDEEERKLRDWYKRFDFKTFIKEYKINKNEMRAKTGLGYSTLYQVMAKYEGYKPSIEKLSAIYNYVNNIIGTKEEVVEVEEQIKYDFEEPIIEEIPNEEIEVLEIEEPNIEVIEEAEKEIANDEIKTDKDELIERLTFKVELYEKMFNILENVTKRN